MRLKTISIFFWILSILFCIFFVRELYKQKKEKELIIARQRVSLMLNREYMIKWLEEEEE